MALNLKVMEYNILYGFHSLEKKIEEKRMEVAKRVVARENPDILVLTEACFGDLKAKRGIKVDYKTLFGYEHGLYQPMYHNEWGLMILSRYPLEKLDPLDMGNRKILRCNATTPLGKIMVDVVHPSPKMREDDKVKDFGKLLESSSSPYLLIGDFNSISDTDKKNYNYKKMLPAVEKFAGKMFAIILLKDLLSFKLVKFLRSKGLIDSGEKSKKFNYTIPSDYLTMDKLSAMRIDHIFHSADIETVEFYNIPDEDAQMASDHLPIVAVLKLKDKPKL